MGEKAQYTQKGRKTLKTGIFHSHPCGFYIKNRPFAIEMAVWGLGLLLFPYSTPERPHVVAGYINILILQIETHQLRDLGGVEAFFQCTQLPGRALAKGDQG